MFRCANWGFNSCHCHRVLLLSKKTKHRVLQSIFISHEAFSECYTSLLWIVSFTCQWQWLWNWRSVQFVQSTLQPWLNHTKRTTEHSYWRILKQKTFNVQLWLCPILSFLLSMLIIGYAWQAWKHLETRETLGEN